ncbi:hypothetical protein HY994_03420 [Candidatus Micrarchaeota archaeon]|nr:hypothetical protein [Candidatus Micrarchaeota archaeon]
MLKRLKKYASFYRIAHHKRVQLYHWKWRLFFILLVAAAMILVYEYLQGRYPYGVFDPIKGVKFMLSERIFEWFSIGVMFGVVALAAMYEGEFMFSVRRLVKHFEMQTLQLLHPSKATHPDKFSASPTTHPLRKPIGPGASVAKKKTGRRYS